MPATATIEAHDGPDLLGWVVTLSAVTYFAWDNREPGERDGGADPTARMGRYRHQAVLEQTHSVTGKGQAGVRGRGRGDGWGWEV